jgi:hypothetical protein
MLDAPPDEIPGGAYGHASDGLQTDFFRRQAPWQPSVVVQVSSHVSLCVLPVDISYTHAENTLMTRKKKIYTYLSTTDSGLGIISSRLRIDAGQINNDVNSVFDYLYVILS